MSIGCYSDLCSVIIA
ncbi:MAG: hypothetical protein GWN13_27605, partial [Phycisphaerae bacterium]|nr:hypothetical protein [Phycisphaerae bacterium]